MASEREGPEMGFSKVVAVGGEVAHLVVRGLHGEEWKVMLGPEGSPVTALVARIPRLWNRARSAFGHRHSDLDAIPPEAVAEARRRVDEMTAVRERAEEVSAHIGFFRKAFALSRTGVDVVDLARRVQDMGLREMEEAIAPLIATRDDARRELEQLQKQARQGLGSEK